MKLSVRCGKLPCHDAKTLIRDFALRLRRSYILFNTEVKCLTVSYIPTQSHPTVTAAAAEWRMFEAAGDVLFQMNWVKPEYIVSDAHYKPAFNWVCANCLEMSVAYSERPSANFFFFLLPILLPIFLRRQSRQNELSWIMWACALLIT